MPHPEVLQAEMGIEVWECKAVLVVVVFFFSVEIINRYLRVIKRRFTLEVGIKQYSKNLLTIR